MADKAPQYNLDYVNNLIEETYSIIEDNPLMQASQEIETIKENFESLQSLINKSGKPKESIGIVASILSKMSWTKNDSHHILTFEDKISSIFRQFDLTYDSIVNSIHMYKNYRDKLSKELIKLEKFIEKYPDEHKASVQYMNYQSLLSTLTLSRDRTNTNLDSAISIEESMRTGRPIFQTTLSACMIEISWQQSLDSSTKMITTLQGTIASMSNTLTDNTIVNAQRSLDIGTQPILSSSIIEDNIFRLGTAVSDIEKQKNKFLLSNSK